MGAGSRCRSPFVAVSRPVDRRTRASSITGVTERRSSALTVRSRGRRSQDACSPGGPGSGSTGCGLRLLFDRERGSGPTDRFAGFGDRTPSGRSDSPGARARGLVLTLGRGHFSPQPQTSQPFTRVRVINCLGGHRRERLHGAHGKEESLDVVGPEVFDSQRVGGYSPLDFPPSGGSCWASWRQARQGRSSVCRASSEVERAAWRRIGYARDPGNEPGVGGSR
jgi:hypothetical protein